MTVKRRIFISHILMFAIPLALCVLFSIGIRLAFTKIYSWNNGFSNNEIFYEARHNLRNMGGLFAESADVLETGGNVLLAAVNDLQKRFLKYGVYFAVYGDGEWLVPLPEEIGPLFDTALEMTGSHSLLFDTIAVYVQPVGNALVMAVSYNFFPDVDMNVPSVMAAGILSFWILIVLVLATHFFLTRGMMRSITVPLDTLSFGVRQIQNNNLGFRLVYKNNDEFLPVCAAFNVMAARLEAMAAEHGKYEENRRELLAGISHDLRTPLTSIKAYLEGIEKEIASTREKREKYIAVIRNKTNDMEHIINQLFLFSKLDINDFPLVMEKFDMGRFMRDAAAEFADAYDKRGLAIVLGEIARDGFVRIDAALFRTVITNILENSVLYKDAERGRIEIGVLKKGAAVEIRLADDGPGVPKESLEKLFDVFYRADPSRDAKGGSPGNGLGLAIAQKIVNRMGGGLKAVLPGRGLELVIQLPFAGPSASGEEA
jgi:signal transduction histidine kinase